MVEESPIVVAQEPVVVVLSADTMWKLEGLVLGTGKTLSEYLDELIEDAVACCYEGWDFQEVRSAR
jgi:hypothetical protein